MKCLQLNLGRGKDAQDLLMQTARERGADVLLISGRSLIGSDFNSKSPERGEARLDRRGIFVGEMVARNDLIVLN